MGKPGPNRRVSDREFLREMAIAPDPIVTANELSERLDYSRAGVNNILDEMVEKGFVIEREVGSRAKVYWLTREGRKKAGKLD
ncbi:MarR family transcriptional regulator [Halorientalis brevis]|uniref:MarR family transcriptional regulator n=1 Tax=Halorientalis brevis TaxID=1126241 RepID=A0ABD6CGV2_9EURY|nr:helix-turn-helix domain-containing protein [Halorientalis brevis]